MAGTLSKDKLLLNIAYHVFLPPKLPQTAPSEDHERRINHRLIWLALNVIDEHRQLFSDPSGDWNRMYAMLDKLGRNLITPLERSSLGKDMADMQQGDVLAIHIREQNAAIIIRKLSNTTTFEIFEAQAPNASVMSTPGKLIRQFPGPAIEVPNSIAEDAGFIDEIANFLAQMNVDVLDAATAKITKAGSKVAEVRDTADPHYISQLFTGILRGFGKEVEPRRIVKRIADEVLWDSTYLPWRRSPIWLIVRVTLQTSVQPVDYKHFMVLFHARILGLCSQEPSFSSDILSAMRVKMARRLLKIRDSAPDVLVEITQHASLETETVLQKRWAAIQDEAPRFGSLDLDTDQAIIQSLPNSREYLSKVLKGRSKRSKPIPFMPSSIARLVGVSDFSMFSDGALTRSFDQNKHIGLFDFENAVHNRFSTWVEENLYNHSANACAVVSSCLDQYATAALSCYEKDTPDLSIMILTVMELWVGLDRLATTQYTILLDYSPEIPESLIDVLLLCPSLHLKRARMVQIYIRRRHNEASRGSVFSPKNNKNSMPVRFFNQSMSLQTLKRTIEQDAEHKRNEKINELHRLNAAHVQLKQEISQAECAYVTGKMGNLKMAKNCQKCAMEKRAKKMKIGIHEWPLPAGQFDAKAAVFELECPEELGIWRSTTQKVLLDLAGATRGEEAIHHGALVEYEGLRNWAKASKRRVTVVSSTKPFRSSHYEKIKIPSTEGQVCVNNGLTFKLFDSTLSVWASGSFTNANFFEYGTFFLPENSPYHYLQYSLEGTSHTSNQVIASQSDCPKNISLHEHYAYGTLRSGPRLQWMNIVRGLEENSLTFTRDEVHILHTQAAWQLGPLSQDTQNREWHSELDDPEFGRVLVRQASRVLDRTRANWLESTTVHTVVMLVARLLSATTDTTTQIEAHAFLRDARNVTFDWVEELLAKLQNADVDVQEFRDRACEMALICRSTYDVDNWHLSELLSNSTDWTALIFCSIALYHNRSPKPEDAPQYMQYLLYRDRRLAFKTLPILTAAFQRNSRLLDYSVARYWSGYRPGLRGWTVLSGPSAQWVTTRSRGDEDDSSQEIHFNTLDGRLLVDGQPFGRLPPEYTSHPTYARLFGQKVLDVVPASSSGMTFSTRIPVNDHKVAFALSTSQELIIQISRNDTIYELVPHSKLLDDLPVFFSSEYHHWINLKTGVVEFRPLDKPWICDESNWCLRFSNHSASTMDKNSGGESLSLVDVHSIEFQRIADQITPLESSRYVHITQSNSTILEIVAELPRMKLAFFLNEDMRLESHNFNGQIIDETQSSGTMFGLKNQLVLCAKNPIAKSLPRSRLVLIPYGTVDFTLQADHTRVTIDCGSARFVPFYQYRIDTDMGYLVNSDTSLTSRLFKIYLHAVTSHCLSDPLTGRTGTEEALHELAESATTSFDQIDIDQACLLKSIGALTPQRAYYPAHLKVMQTTKWASLPSLAQHYTFSTITNLVLARARSLQLFNPLNFDIEPYNVNREQNLLKRAAYRTRTYYPVDSDRLASIVPEGSSTSDHWYEGKDHLSRGWTSSGQQASWVSGLVQRGWSTPIYLSYRLVSQFEKWGQVQGPGDSLPMTYSQEWLGLDLSSDWLSMYDMCRNTDSSNAQYGLSICLAAGVYSGWLPSELVPVLLAFAANPRFRLLPPPTHDTYQLSDKYAPTFNRVLEIVDNHRCALESTPSNSIAKTKDESKTSLRQRRRADYDANISSLKWQLAQYWVDCWPNGPSAPSGNFSSWFNVNGCLQQVCSYLRSCSKNVDIQSHLRQVEMLMASGPTTPNIAYSIMPPALLKPTNIKPHSIYLGDLLCFDQLVQHRTPQTLPDVSETQSIVSVSLDLRNPPDTTQLEDLLDELYGDSTHALRRRYASDLETSRMNLAQTSAQETLKKLPSLMQLQANRAQLRVCLKKNLEMINKWLGPTTELEDVVFASGIWTRLTPRAILGKLTLQARTGISANHQVEFVKFAQTYIEYQRSHRLISLALEDKHEEFYKELKSANVGSDAEPNDPDWLLVQIDGNFSARKVQAQVAREMISPSSEASTVLQLNMGEGKSSVIVPIVAAALADSTRLVRVVVLKPLWRQMFHLLVNRLSGLVNRRIYYLPFGRHIRVGEEQAKQIHHMYEECMREGGILLVQPEHILSFKLMGIDQLLSSSTPKQTAASKCLQETEKWLSDNARDILDESDEILHVRYQLVYTVGEQKSLEGHPDRWTTTQQVLSLVAGHISRLKQAYPDKLKYEVRGSGQFPFIRIMPESNEIVAKLIRSVAEDSISGLVPNLNFSLLPKATRHAALRFVTTRNLSRNDAKMLKKLDSSLRNGLLLLRGLLAYGIIAFALRDKHYRVDYGLHLSRSLLAVPYHAKDIPSPRAEFGHPDVAILLTCLSYYNNGLDTNQLEICFDLLFKLDNPGLEYEQWVRRNEAIPPNLCQLKGVNLKNHDQFIKQIVPTFSRNGAVVDFFLSSVVFPKAAKQFPYKLSTSGWDLAEIKTHVTTGFSGTNDNRYLLPASITQSDPVKQSSTNALVLTYLLQPENNHYLCIRGANGETSSAKEFLHTLAKQDPEIRVLLDVGAQMLELTNDELVKYWLELQPDVAAAVYFNDEDELVILPQNGSPTPFHASPFAQQMDRCIVYLDDGHTRGTDLKLPKGTRAAVTLGPKVTKDRLLQGCMRMRKLGFGQSVMFCAPTEIDNQIRNAAKLADKDQVQALDVIRWAMLETCKDLEHHTSHWAQQGVEHNRRANALKSFASTTSTEALKRGWLTLESRSLEEMYDPASEASESFTATALGIPSLKRQLAELGIRDLEDPSMDEEQEREVSHERERERERQIERPIKLHAAPHSVHPEILRFVQTGLIPSTWSGMASLFYPLKAAGALQPGTWSSNLVASLDFCQTLRSTNLMKINDYMRPVNWVLSGKHDVLLVLSPYEANELLPGIRKSAHVRLHVFAPRTIQSMLSFSDLQFYSLPSPTRSNARPPILPFQLQLSLFAGQLYFDDYAQYRALCGFLGVFIGTDDSREANDIRVQSNGFVTESDRLKLAVYIPEYLSCNFKDSPIAAIKELVGYRRKGMEFLRTHLGQILHARQLTENDF